mmetsp:Transcript_21264/g.38802  ORF Transcript_21264/g.38802 Transcript_21264/m.38802 type:complete len:200 (-) Transcript_21264:237-836(-)
MQQPQQDVPCLLANAYLLCRACLTLHYGVGYNAAYDGPMRDAPEVFLAWLDMAASVFVTLRCHYKGQHAVGGELVATTSCMQRAVTASDPRATAAIQDPQPSDEQHDDELQQDDIERMYLLTSARRICRACLALQYRVSLDAVEGGCMRDAPASFRRWLAMAPDAFAALRRCYEGVYQIGDELVLAKVEGEDAEDCQPW